jgi:hypothetical protein
MFSVSDTNLINLTTQEKNLSNDIPYYVILFISLRFKYRLFKKNVHYEHMRLISAEMRFLRRTAGYTRWDHKRNEDSLTELQISQITEFICQYRKNWKEHVDRMGSDRIPKMILKYQPTGKRNLGRSLKRWKDSVL